MEQRDRPRVLPGPGGGARSGFDEAEVVRRLKDSDPGALREIYTQHSSGIYALCMRMMRDAHRAEEVMQDTFWQLWSKPDQFNAQRGKISTFLFQVARSRCLDRLRAERSQTNRVRSAYAEVELSERDHAGPTPLHLAMQAEDRSRVRQALDALAPEYREVVILSYFDGLPQVEIAERLGAPLGTVKTRMRRGLIQLRKSLRGAAPT